MHWLLQKELFKPFELEQLTQTLERFGFEYSFHKVVPIVGELLPHPIITQDKVICLGSYSMRHAAKKYNWSPGLYDLFEYNFNEQLKNWGDKLLNAASKVCAFKDVKITKPTFMRPIEDTKNFAGKVFTPEEFNEWQPKVLALGANEGRLSGQTLIQVCPVYQIFAEYRFWIVAGEIVSSSLYKRGDQVFYSKEVPPIVKDFAAHCVAQWAPAPAFVLDVCDTPNGLKIVEINTINSAGFYAGDIQQIVLALDAMESPSLNKIEDKTLKPSF